MTTHKLFKRRVRQRMAKTGESYTTARHQLAAKRDRLRADRADLASAVELASEATLTDKTDRGWEAWISILDGWGAREQTHGATAQYLMDTHGVSGWWAQTITNGYERARGIRAKHQQPNGFTIYASKTVGVPIAVVSDAFTDDAVRARWLTDGSMAIRSAQPRKVARFDWGGGPTRVMVTFEAKGPERATASVAHERLPDADVAEAAKAAWRGRLTGLKTFLETGSDLEVISREF